MKTQTHTSSFASILKSTFMSTRIIGLTAAVGALVMVPIVSQTQSATSTVGDNAVNGAKALASNTTGSDNAANGVKALFSNTTGGDNTANGFSALLSNTTGSNNTANGAAALYFNTTGGANTANGRQSLYNNTKGGNNTATGSDSLVHNTTGHNNTATGSSSLLNNRVGNFNIGLGDGAGLNIIGSNNIIVGNPGMAADNGTIRIGATGTHTSAYIAGINGVTASGGVAVYVNAQGQLGTLTSSRRFKNDIKDMGTVSEKLMSLRPVTFKYKSSAEKGEHHQQYGLIAEEVAKVYPDLVQYDKQGKPFTVYYYLLTPMLLNELQKEHRRNEAQSKQIATQQQQLAALQAAHKAELTELKTALQQQRTELAALQLAQQEQNRQLAQMANALSKDNGPRVQLLQR